MAQSAPARVEKKALQENRVILYVDEAACYLMPLVAATWSKKGQTPELNPTCSYAHLSLLGAVTPTGSLYLTGQDVAFTGEDIVRFLSYLCHRYRRYNLLVIWDGAARRTVTIHRSQAVKEFLKAHPGRVHLERLPGYSPELNAAEMLWSQRSAAAVEKKPQESSISNLVRFGSCLENTTRTIP